MAAARAMLTGYEAASTSLHLKAKPRSTSLARPYRPQDWRREAVGRPAQQGSRLRLVLDPKHCAPASPTDSPNCRPKGVGTEARRQNDTSLTAECGPARPRAWLEAGPGGDAYTIAGAWGGQDSLTGALSRPLFFLRTAASREPAAETRWVPECRADSAVGGSHRRRIADAVRGVTVCCLNSTAQKRHPWRRAQDPRSGTLGSLSAAQLSEAPRSPAGASQVNTTGTCGCLMDPQLLDDAGSALNSPDAASMSLLCIGSHAGHHTMQWHRSADPSAKARHPVTRRSHRPQHMHRQIHDQT